MNLRLSPDDRIIICRRSALLLEATSSRKQLPQIRRQLKAEMTSRGGRGLQTRTFPPFICQPVDVQGT